jgi:hypothetical protein
VNMLQYSSDISMRHLVEIDAHHVAQKPVMALYRCLYRTNFLGSGVIIL